MVSAETPLLARERSVLAEFCAEHGLALGGVGGGVLPFFNAEVGAVPGLEDELVAWRAAGDRALAFGASQLESLSEGDLKGMAHFLRTLDKLEAGRLTWNE